jgi:hypothetical protein
VPFAEDQLNDLLERARAHERRARRRALLYSLVPAVLAGLLIWFTANQLRALQQRLDDVQGRLNATQEQLKEKVEELQKTEQRLQQATDFARYVHPLSLVDAKAIASRFPEAARVLRRILELRNDGVGWHLGGTSPRVGFDSPGFAAFVLRSFNVPLGDVQLGDSVAATSQKLWENLPPASSPEVGDLVFYPAGYVLFYFTDRQQQPFVIGMTPFGITALKPDFAQPRGYRRAAP